MERKELIEKINQAKEENKHLLDQNEKLIFSFDNNDSDVLKDEKDIVKKIELNAKQLELELEKIEGVVPGEVQSGGPGHGTVPITIFCKKYPHLCNGMQGSIKVHVIYRQVISEPLRDSNADIRELELLLKKFELGNKRLELENERLSL